MSRTRRHEQRTHSPKNRPENPEYSLFQVGHVFRVRAPLQIQLEKGYILGLARGDRLICEGRNEFTLQDVPFELTHKQIAHLQLESLGSLERLRMLEADGQPFFEDEDDFSEEYR